MLSEKENIRISKLMSLVLRHKPETIGLTLNENGWADVDELMTKMSQAGVNITPEILQFVVGSNSKSRFAFSTDGTKIRASQGHSVSVELGYTPQTPPEILYHGTAEHALKSIFKTGLQKRERQHVHLSTEVQTATMVGQRYGRPVILKVAAARMHNEGFIFYLSENNVWLTDHVPVEYLAYVN
jgi:putative RNA 2'-phosphotransferase